MDIVKKLVDSGKFTLAEAEAFAKGMAAGADKDGDKLVKALENVRDVLSKGGAGAIYTQADMDRLAAESGSTIEAIAAGTDQIVKGFQAIVDKQTELTIALTEAVLDLKATHSKEIEGLHKSLGLPLPRKSVSEDPAAHGVKPSPADGAGTGDVLTKSMVSNAAIAAMATASADRKQELSRAVSRLGAGASAEQVAKEFSITVG